MDSHEEIQSMVHQHHKLDLLSINLRLLKTTPDYRVIILTAPQALHNVKGMQQNAAELRILSLSKGNVLKNINNFSNVTWLPSWRRRMRPPSSSTSCRSTMLSSRINLQAASLSHTPTDPQHGEVCCKYYRIIYRHPSMNERRIPTYCPFRFLSCSSACLLLGSTKILLNASPFHTTHK